VAMPGLFLLSHQSGILALRKPPLYFTRVSSRSAHLLCLLKVLPTLITGLRQPKSYIVSPSL
jgi:hypothetical protein